MRMLYEMYNQLLGRWPEDRAVKDPKFGLTHNLGGVPNTTSAPSPSSAWTEPAR